MGQVKFILPDGTYRTLSNKDILSVYSPDEGTVISYLCSLLGLDPARLSKKTRKDMYDLFLSIQMEPDIDREIKISYEQDVTSNYNITTTTSKDLIEVIKNHNHIWIKYDEIMEILPVIKTYLTTLPHNAYIWNRASGLRPLSDKNTSSDRHTSPEISILLQQLSTLQNSYIILEDLDIPLGKDRPTDKQLAYIHQLRNLLSNNVLSKNNVHLIVLSRLNEPVGLLKGLFTEVIHISEKLKYLSKYAENLSAKVKNSPEKYKAYFREDIILRMRNILNQNEMNNILLVGRAGVGKTQIVAHLALELDNRAIYQLNLEKLFATSGIAGELENRIDKLLKEVSLNKERVVVFIDEIHRIMQDNRYQRFLEAILPALNDGTFPLIGITTENNANKLLKYEAFARRVVIVEVPELTIEQTAEILKNKISNSNSQYKSSDTIIEKIARYAHDYVKDIALPTSAIKVLNILLSQNKPITDESIKQAVSEISQVKMDWESKIPLLETELPKKIIGQEKAISDIVSLLKLRILQPSNPKPVVMLFMGPTGTGKTQTAIYIADILFGSTEYKLFNMAQLHDPSAINTFIGSPPGYVGYDRGGSLTNWLKHHKSSVVIFDEFEKAHPEIYKVLMQLFDKGIIQDAEGKEYDGSHSIYILTSNLGQEYFNNTPDVSQLREILRANGIPPEFIGRISKIIWFNKLKEDSALKILQLIISSYNQDPYTKIKVKLTDKALDYILQKSNWESLGVRKIRDAFDELVITKLADYMMKYEYNDSTEVLIDYQDNQLVFRI